jgi:hypothetical protein
MQNAAARGDLRPGNNQHDPFMFSNPSQISRFSNEWNAKLADPNLMPCQLRSGICCGAFYFSSMPVRYTVNIDFGVGYKGSASLDYYFCQGEERGMALHAFESMVATGSAFILQLQL